MLLWLTQRQMADLFDTTPENIVIHLKNIFGDKELEEAATAKDFLVVQTEGKHQVRRNLKHYILDAIISVGYRVNSRRGVHFRHMKTIIPGAIPLSLPVPVRANNYSPLPDNDPSLPDNHSSVQSDNAPPLPDNHSSVQFDNAPPLPARNRRSVRLRGYDYSQAGAYFITICAQNRHCLFGSITEGAMVLNDAGRMVADCWLQIPDHFLNIELDEWVVMPNHIHGIVVIVGANHHSIVRANDDSPLPANVSHPTGTARTIGSMVRGFKIGVTKWYRKRSVTSKIWQRNYWDHIIRNESELNRIRQYILDNPMQWEQDSLHAPTAVGENTDSPIPNNHSPTRQAYAPEAWPG
jgi:REP element-mobilizing transposase RayT